MSHWNHIKTQDLTLWILVAFFLLNGLSDCSGAVGAYARHQQIMEQLEKCR